MNNINHLCPSIVWTYFNDICGIPHPSKKEGLLVEYIIDFAESHSLEYVRDQLDNILIKKPASEGMESVQSVILQGHLDMVPEKNSHFEHNFEKDPILPVIQGEWVSAKGTTLGADNGIGVAAILAVLDSSNLSHGPLMALFTIEEETGMAGALGLDKSLLNSPFLINLDSEKDGELYIGCAGGSDINIHCSLSKVPADIKKEFFKVEISGLVGGHSGFDISLGRGNSIKLLFQLLVKIVEKIDLEIGSLNGGSLRNVIPRDSSVVLGVVENSKKDLLKILGEFSIEVKKIYFSADPGIKITCEPIQNVTSVFENKKINIVINKLNGCPNGMRRMNDEFESVVETSSSLGVLSCDEQRIDIQCMVRSLSEESKQSLVSEIVEILSSDIIEVKIAGGYPGWQPDKKSKILKIATSSYKDLFQEDPSIKVIHAGLECGILGAPFPDMEMLSFGPTIVSPHSPNERVNISSVSKFWEFLKKLLEDIPERVNCELIQSNEPS